MKASPQRSEARRPSKAKAAARARPAAEKPVLIKKPAVNAGGKQTPKAAAQPAPRVVTKPVAAKPVAAKQNSTPKLVDKPATKSPASKTAAAPVLAPAKLARSAKPGKAAKPVQTAAESSPPPPKKPARKSIKEAAGVSTDAVARRTGKSWDDWFEVLDSAGAATLDQRGVIAILAQKHGIGPWWQQMIAVGYESLRAKSDRPPAVDGFHINSSCTLDAPLPRVFRLWNDAGERARWLADDRFVVRGATADKVIRARWGKGTSHVAVSFAEKSGRTEVSVEHHQIESRGAAEQMKAYWAKKLGLLDQALAPRR